jgi:hypothetical protein
MSDIAKVEETSVNATGFRAKYSLGKDLPRNLVRRLSSVK